mgnify:CR=1 FL=1
MSKKRKRGRPKGSKKHSGIVRISPQQERIQLTNLTRTYKNKLLFAKTERAYNDYLGFYLEEVVELIFLSLGYQVSKYPRGSHLYKTVDIEAIKFYSNLPELHLAIECLNSYSSYSYKYVNRIRTRLKIRMTNVGAYPLVICVDKKKNFQYDPTILSEPFYFIEIGYQLHPDFITLKDYLSLKKKVRKVVSTIQKEWRKKNSP